MNITAKSIKQVSFTISSAAVKPFSVLFCLFLALSGWGQPVEGTSYYLPKVGLRFTLRVEKTVYEPGEFAAYAQRYMKLRDVQLESFTSYSLIGISVNTFAVPDTAKHFTLLLDKRYSVSDVCRSDNGILLAINEQKIAPVVQPAAFKPAAKPQPLNPHDYMNEDILTAGSTTRMAQLTAQEIYDIRDSRSQLQRGQAEFMPKDGQQLRIMMDGLDTQERALRQVFEGTTVKDTAEVVLDYLPSQSVNGHLLFRFSRYFGVVDSDDLSGTPYYINIEADSPIASDDGKKKEKNKDDIGLNVNIPAKATATLLSGRNPVKTLDFYAPQFGTVENLSGALFGKKQTTRIVLNPVTGGIESIKEVALDK